MQDFEQKYLDLLKETASMRSHQKSLSRCNDSATRRKAKLAEDKVDKMIQLEIGKSIQLLNATKTLFS